MPKERYIFGLKSPTLNSLEGEPNKELLYDFYKSFEGFYMSNCFPEWGQLHFPKKVKSKKLKDNNSYPIFLGKILDIAKGGKNAVNIELKVLDDRVLKGTLTKKRGILSNYEIIFSYD